MSLLEVCMSCTLVSSSIFRCYPWRCRGAWRMLFIRPWFWLHAFICPPTLFRRMAVGSSLGLSFIANHVFFVILVWHQFRKRSRICFTFRVTNHASFSVVDCIENCAVNYTEERSRLGTYDMWFGSVTFDVTNKRSCSVTFGFATIRFHTLYGVQNSQCYASSDKQMQNVPLHCIYCTPVLTQGNSLHANVLRNHSVHTF